MSKQARGEALDLELLSALGFGPEALMMNEPRLFIDRSFVASLILELESRFDRDTAGTILFQIGVLHGLRDAYRIIQSDFLPPGLATLEGESPPVAEATPLAIALGARGNADPTTGAEIPGAWPERFEAEARLARVGPSSSPSCLLSAGYTSGWLSGILEADFLVKELECGACGESSCRFVAREVGSWLESGDRRMEDLIEAVPFDALRQAALGPGGEPPSQSPALHPENNDVHVWGPVMVLPFTGPDGFLQAIDRLGREPATCATRVVVLDLRSRILDEGFDSSALETGLDSIEGWGAEVILTGVSPFSEAAVAQLEANHLLLRKSLSEAITAAFQVAEAQRYLL